MAASSPGKCPRGRTARLSFEFVQGLDRVRGVDDPPYRNLPSHHLDERAQCHSGTPEKRTSLPPETTVPELAESLSGNFRNTHTRPIDCARLRHFPHTG